MARITLALIALLVFGLGFGLAWTRDESLPTQNIDGVQTREPAAPPVEANPPTADLATARATAPPEAEWWLKSLTEASTETLAAAAGEPEAAVLRGRLTVRQQPWLHPSNTEVRITRCWLDSVLPIETGPGQQVPARDEPSTRSDAEGRFTLHFRPGPDELFFLIGHGSEFMDFQKIAHLPQRGGELDLGDVFLDQRGGITGTLLDERGVALANVKVRAVDDPLMDATSGFEELRAERSKGLDLFQVRGTLASGPMPAWVVRRDNYLSFPTATTDAQGRFRLRGVRPGTHDLFCSLERGASLLLHGSSSGVLVAGGRDTDVGSITLHPAMPITLQFRDDFGQAWVGAEVAFVQQQLGFGTQSVRTDADGRASLMVPKPSTARLLFAYPGGGPWIRVAGDQWPIVRISRPKELKVELVDVLGRRLPGGRVQSYVVAEAFRPVDRRLPDAMQPVEREPGFHVGKLPCPVVLVATVPGFAPGMELANDAETRIVMLLPLQTMTVRTHDLSGAPVAGAAIRIQVHDNPEMLFAGSQWAALANDRVLAGRTDENGELRVPCWPTLFSLQASHAQFAPSAGPKLLAVAGERREILMRRRSQIFGTVTIDGRAAPKGMRVRAVQKPPDANELADSGFLGEQLAVTGDDGTFAFRDLSAGLWRLTPELPATSAAPAGGPALRFRSHELLLSDEQEMHCFVEAQRDPMAMTNIAGSVLQNGAQLRGVLVRLRDAGDPPPRNRNTSRRRGRPSGEQTIVEPFGADEVMPWAQRFETGYTGSFEFGDLVPGQDYELRFDVPLEGRLQFLGRRRVRAGTTQKPATVDLALTTGNVRLRCTHNTKPFANRMLRLRQMLDDGQEGARFEVLLDELGETVIEALPAGDWTIEPNHGGRCQPAELRLTAGAMVAPIIEIID